MGKPTITISLDAWFDLNQAGRPSDPASVDGFEATYRKAGKVVGRELGIIIEVTSVNSYSPALDGDGDAEEERRLWQAIHDRLAFRDGKWAVKK